jgi:hypothetical protein
MKENETLMTIIVKKDLKNAFENAVGKKYMSHNLRQQMKKIIAKSKKNDIH